MNYALCMVLSICYWEFTAAGFESWGFEVASRGGSELLWQHDNVLNPLTCAVVCMGDVRCWTFTYSTAKMKCHGYAVSRASKQNSADIMYDRSYVIFYKLRLGISLSVQDAAQSGHGRQCSRDKECDFEDFICHAGVCLCKIGLYYSPQGNTCLKECLEFGDKMDVYKGVSISSHNTKIQYLIPIADCLQHCLEEKEFTCLTVDLRIKGAMVCQLSKSGFLDVDKKYRQFSKPDWNLGQRQCK